MNSINDTVNNSSHIYFVCSGNIIRSAFAEIFANSIGIINCSSFGTRYRNTKIHREAQNALKEKGINPNIIQNFSPTFITEIFPINKNSIFLIMTTSHKEDLVSHDIDSNRIYYLSELLGTIEEIDDPYFTNNYKAVFETIERAILQLHEINP